MTRHEYYITMADLTKQIIPYLESANLQKFYMGAAEQFIERSRELTVEECCEPASQSNLDVYKHYSDKLKKLKADYEEEHATR